MDLHPENQANGQYPPLGQPSRVKACSMLADDSPTCQFFIPDELPWCNFNYFTNMRVSISGVSIASSDVVPSRAFMSELRNSR